MPNWCKNTLTVKPENIMKDILTHYVRKDEKSKYSFFDFERIIPIHTFDNDEIRHKDSPIQPAISRRRPTAIN